MHHMNWLSTLVTMAGNPDIKEERKAGGVKAIRREYKVHLDGCNILPYLLGKRKPLGETRHSISRTPVIWRSIC